jgi:hypothetical protein
MSTLGADVIRKFRKRINATVINHRELLLAVHEKRRQASLESMLAEQFALNVAVLWEVFLSDLLMAYVSEDPRTYMGDLQGRIKQSVRERFGQEASKCMKLDFPATVAPDRIAAWLDPKDFNVTVKSADALAQRANSMLSALHAKKFTLEPEDSEIVDFTVALRHYLAHRSIASRHQLLQVAKSLSGPNQELCDTIHKVGPYLKFRTTTGDTRAALVASRLSAVSARLE